MNHIGERIKELRRKNDLTQEKLADYLGVTYQSVSSRDAPTGMARRPLSQYITYPTTFRCADVSLTV